MTEHTPGAEPYGDLAFTFVALILFDFVKVNILDFHSQTPVGLKNGGAFTVDPAALLHHGANPGNGANMKAARIPA